MPTIRVEMFEGRTLEQKRALAQALTEATVRTLLLEGAAFEHLDANGGHGGLSGVGR